MSDILVVTQEDLQVVTVQAPATVVVEQEVVQTVNIVAAGPQGIPGEYNVMRTDLRTSVTPPLVWDSDDYDVVDITAQAENLTIAADSGTPINNRKMIFRIEDNGVQRTIGWATGVSKGFREAGASLPLLTAAGKTVTVGCMYNVTKARWDVIAVAQTV